MLAQYFEEEIYTVAVLLEGKYTTARHYVIQACHSRTLVTDDETTRLRSVSERLSRAVQEQQATVLETPEPGCGGCVIL